MNNQRYLARAALLLCLFLISQTCFAQSIVHVKANATGANDGSSWANAFNSLQDGLAAANAGDQIWVAEGVYYPTSGTDRSISFELVRGTQLYGGFPATGTPTMASRDPQLHPTTLNGDIGTPGLAIDNSKTVVKSIGAPPGDVLDGFYIINAHGENINGGGLSIRSGGSFIGANPFNHLVVRNCNFNTNWADNGAAVYIFSQLTSSTHDTLINLFENCEFSGNQSFNNGFIGTILTCSYEGFGLGTFKNCKWEANGECSLLVSGGNTIPYPGTVNLEGCRFSQNFSDKATVILVRGRTLNIEDCVFDNNIGYKSGVILDFNNGTNQLPNFLNVTNCTMYNNTSAFTGVFYTSALGQRSFENCIFWNNGAGRQLFNGNYYTPAPNDEEFYSPILANGNLGSTTVNNSMFSSSSLPPLVTGGNNCLFNTDPQFINPAGGDLALLPTSPAINQGDNAQVAPSNATDIAGDARIYDNTVELGAYEFSVYTPPCPSILYVNRIATGANHGRDWANAYLDLQDALAFARANGCVDTILIAKGDHFPYPANGYFGFELVNDVEIYGGFPNTGNPWFPDRDLVLHETIFNGDLGVLGDPSDNSNIVVSAGNRGTVAGTFNAGTLLDGVSIANSAGAIRIQMASGGSFEGRFNQVKVYDNSLGSQPFSRAILVIGNNNTVNNPVFSNCEVTNNFQPSAAMYPVTGGVMMFGNTYTGTVNALFENCVFENNGGVSGAAHLENYSNATFQRCRFSQNFASEAGGAIRCRSAAGYTQSLVLENCLFNDNEAQAIVSGTSLGGSGGAIAVEQNGSNARVQARNCTFDGNSAWVHGHISAWGTNAQVDLDNCILYNSVSSTGWGRIMGAGTGAVINMNHCLVDAPNCGAGGGAGDLYTNGGAINCVAGMLYNVLPQYTAPLAGNYSLQLTSPAINAGNNALVDPGMTTDIAGNTRIEAGTVDMGCYENFSGMVLRPAANIHASRNPVLLGLFNSSQLTASMVGGNPPYSYRWNTGATTSSIVVSPISDTQYSVEIKDAEGVLVQTALLIRVQDFGCTLKKGQAGYQVCYNGTTQCLQLADAEYLITHGLAVAGPCPEEEKEPTRSDPVLRKTSPVNSGLELWPNPTRQVLHIALDTGDMESGMVWDAQGKMVLEWSGTRNQLNVEALSPGIYLLQLQTKDERLNQRFVVE